MDSTSDAISKAGLVYLAPPPSGGFSLVKNGPIRQQTDPGVFRK